MKIATSVGHSALFLAVMFTLVSCSITTYTPRSKRQQQFAKPSVALIEKIVDYRERYGTWPLSKEDFMARDIQYKNAFNGFPYQSTRFKIKDNDNMTFYFEQHIQDVANYQASEKVDLNAFQGEVKFYKEQGKILWKIKMY